MVSKITQYKVASTQEDYRNCHTLIEEDIELEYPTVMAVRNGKAIGMIATTKGKENMIASPMVANSIFTGIKLYTLYDETMMRMGEDHYLFNIERNNKKMMNTVERLFDIKPFTETGDLLWYVRRL